MENQNVKNYSNAEKTKTEKSRSKPEFRKFAEI